MPSSGLTDEAIAHVISAISALGRNELIERWMEAYGRRPPKGTSRQLMELAAAYQLQAKEVGGLSSRLQGQLRRSVGGGAAQCKAVVATGRFSRRPISAGTRLVREWNGRTHVVEVTDNGYLWNGRNWRSLSEVARAITGTRWSGPRFVGL